MPKVKVAGFAVSLDGFGAGPDQSLQSPLGKGGTDLHRWMYKTRMFQKMFGGGEGTTFYFVTDGIESALKKAKEAERVTTENATHVVLKR